MSQTNGQPNGSDPLVVRCADLAPHLEEHREKWQQERPPNIQHFETKGHADWQGKRGWGQQNRKQFTTWGEYIEQEADVDQRTMYRLMHQQEYCTLKVAERLLMAIDREYLLSNGTVPVIPNPRWSQERWHKYMEERGCI